MSFAFLPGMTRRGFTLVELLIVVLVISILAAMIIHGVVAAQHAAREATAEQMIRQVQTAAELFARDHGGYPPTQGGPPYDSGPFANGLSRTGPKMQPYMYFEAQDVASWPMSNSSHIRNPANRKTWIHVRDNTRNPGGRNRFGLDIWGEDCDGNPIGIRTWK